MQIFLDLDGVCTEFVTAAMRFHGLSNYNDSMYPCDVGFDIVTAYTRLTGNVITGADFWNPLDRNFWATLPKTDLCDPLIGYLEREFGKDNICILSAATLSPNCLSGKMEWVYENLPKWIHRQYIFTSKKHHCAKEGTLLIDDADHNVNDFYDCGGEAVLVPRPWNKLNHFSTIPYLFNRLDDYAFENKP